MAMERTPFLLVCLYISATAYTTQAQNAGRTTYKVTTILDKPYTLTCDVNNPPSSSPPCTKGFVVDILREIEKRIPVNFDIWLVNDGRYGAQIQNTNWTGMIGELVRNEADLAAAGLTVTSLRGTHVHYTQPFLDSGLRILVKKPESRIRVEDMFVVLTPFRAEVWVLVCVLCIGVAVMLFVIGRYHPEEATRTSMAAADNCEGALTWSNSLYFSISCMTWQGYSFTPRAIAARTLACFWWVFALIVIVTYTANMAAFFRTKAPSTSALPFLSFNEMSLQTDVQYGCIIGGSTLRYFRNSKRPMEQRIWKSMSQAKPSVFMNSTLQAIRRVQSSGGKFAFIMEESSAEYAASQNCELMVVGESLADRSYSFACSSASTALCRQIDPALLSMKEDSSLHELYRKWFTGTGGCINPDEEEYVFYGLPFAGPGQTLGKATAVKLKHLGGPFLIMFIGIVASAVILLLEIFVFSRFMKTRGVSMNDDRRNIPGSMVGPK